MPEPLDIRKTDRLLVLAPHPDDETLATGNLIQSALAAGAYVRVIVATDGDNNPWPQRWLEKRWRIDAQARQRWGARRRGEVAQALSRLGVSAEATRHFGWPDQGLTDALMRDARCEDQLVAELLEFAPTVIAAPSLVDLHPDHNALRVMLELALARTPHAGCQRLSFVVHGRLPEGKQVAPDSLERYAATKHLALQAHLSQLVLSRRRMSRLCARSELFLVDAVSAAGDAEAHEVVVHIPLSTSPFGLHSNALHVIASVAGEQARVTLAIPRKGAILHAEESLVEQMPLIIDVRHVGDGLELTLRCTRPIGQVFVKNEKLGERVVIYDKHGWLQT